MTSTSVTVFCDVKVISTDTTANTMTTDGGAWTGSNGTSSGDAADRETTVTGPALSGTGNFLSNNGAVVTVSNSNQQWISNDNRLSTDFYIKPVTASLNSAKSAHVALQAAIATAFTNYPTNVTARTNAINATLASLIASGSVSSAEQAALEAVVADGLS